MNVTITLTDAHDLEGTDPAQQQQQQQQQEQDNYGNYGSYGNGYVDPFSTSSAIKKTITAALSNRAAVFYNKEKKEVYPS